MKIRLPNRKSLFWLFAIPVFALGNGWFISVFGLNANFLILFFFLFLIIPLYSLCSRKAKIKKWQNKNSKLPIRLLFIILSVYLYGTFLGVINGYGPENVIRHGFSLLFFLSLIVINWLKPTLQDIIRIFKVVAFLVFLQAAIVYLSVLKIIDPGIAEYAAKVTYGIIGGNEYGFPRAFMSHQLAIFPYLSLLLFSNKPKKQALFALLSVLLLIFTATRAYILVISVLVAIYIFLRLSRQPLYSFCISCLAIFGIASVILSNRNASILISSIGDFSGANISNSARIEQLYWLAQYISRNPIVGYGFGFWMPESVRDTVKKYSYELIYINLWACLGILAFILIGVFFAPLLLGLFKFGFKDQRLHLIAGAIVTNFASLGNPFLLSQCNIALVVMAYYLLILPSENPNFSHSIAHKLEGLAINK